MATVHHEAKVGKRNKTTLLMTCVVDACIALAPLHPYIYASSPKTNSIYIKFKVNGIGTLRISDHPSRYSHKWNINTSKNFKDKVTDRNGWKLYHSCFVNRFKFFKFVLEVNK
jgi:hypothetical protein